jgi:sugar lactone lactonase YvrE
VRCAAALATMLVLSLAAAIPAAAQERPRFDAQLLAKVPVPGYPAQAYTHPNGRIYEGTYTNPGGDSLRSRVFEYSASGTLLRSWTVPGQDLSAEHGIQVATSDARGRLVLLDRTPARLLLLDLGTGEFTQVASVPDLPACPGGQPQPGCSPTLDDRPPMPNYAAWGPDGSLYVTDYLQGVVWRLPPGLDEPAVWLSDRKLDGDMFGTTGIDLAADGRTLLISQQSSGGGGDGNPTTGKLYSVAIQPDGSPGALERVWESGPVDGPDGFAIAASGRIYITLLAANQLAVVEPDGTESARVSSPLFDSPSNAAFLGTSVIVANQSFVEGNPDNWTLVDVAAGERGLEELIPGRDTTAPRVTRLRVGRKRRSARFRLSEPALVEVVVDRRRRGRWIRKRTIDRRRSAGRRSIRFGRRLPAGRYRVVVEAADESGNDSLPRRRRFRVRRR